ncbi:PASTA domain-containing penicillin-binding protein [Ammoniphilus sp. CFH 90114]|uniref:PASTA domain-containing penicillin-binding protein n=1 Tax=Ammoniphilus sp. CFH 90114 TaxID=2493665 RepID=UPI00100E0F96|nr:PASTA domain-containing penicillin-binding protein [Ammoniphilus sp. CFH 90114]RXT15000.1 PASTA domain-containing protein [Ammoniphilus sp. CFH 90114]
MTEKRIKLRTGFLGVFFTLLFFLLIFRLFYIQTVNADLWVQSAQAQWERNDILHPKRGTVFDRNGEVLAYTSKAYTVIAKLKPWDKSDENYIQNSLEAGQRLAPLLGMSTERLVKLIEDGREAGRAQVELRPGGWKIDEDKAKRILEQNIPGVILYPETKRYYPNDAFASHVIGYTDLDGKAIMGIEKLFNEELEGKEGSYTVLKDRKGFKLPDGIESFKPAQNGSNIYLTIDYQIQNYVEDALNKITQQYKTKGISVIVADPKTGEILAMANRPQFNPNQYKDITNWTNFAISNTFEPGSTFKIVTLAAAIEEKMYRNDEQYLSGTYRKIPGPPIRDHNAGKGWGTISFLRGVQESSNVLFAILGYERLGKDKFYDYLEKFGFGQQTGIGLPGEAAAPLKDKSRLYPRDVASMTFGQGVVVTSIQQVAAVSAIANGGELLRPYIIKEIRDSQNGQVLLKHEREVVRRVISENTAQQVRDILETVVTDGTGRYYYIDGYHVAGKTGTAQVVQDGSYKVNKYIYSFIGFAPKDDPEFLVYVVVDQPEIPDANFGGRDVAAPIFKHVMQNSLQYKKVTPNISGEKPITVSKAKELSVPQLMGKTPAEAQAVLIDASLKGKVLGSGTKVTRQYPEAQHAIMPESTVYLITDQLDEIQMPDFTGMTLREVMEFCNILGLKVEPTGRGFVMTQSIPPGSVTAPGEQLKIQLKPNSSPEEEVVPEIEEAEAEETTEENEPQQEENSNSPSFMN